MRDAVPIRPALTGDGLMGVASCHQPRSSRLSRASRAAGGHWDVLMGWLEVTALIDAWLFLLFEKQSIAKDLIR